MTGLIKYSFCSILGLILLLISCKKDEPATLPFSPPIPKDKIIIGEEKGLYTVSDNYNINARNSTGLGYLILDLDKDGMADYRITTNYWCDLGGTNPHFSSSILCLHPGSMINGNYFTDSMFCRIRQDTNNDSDGTIWVVKDYFFSCYRKTAEYNFAYIKNLGYKGYNKSTGDVMLKTDLFRSDTFDLARSNDGYPITGTFHGDSIFCGWISWDVSCWNFPLEKEGYIGIKLKTTDRERIGWIKLILNDISDITILETAIER